MSPVDNVTHAPGQNHSKPSPWMGEGGEAVVHPVTAEIER
jgi:hypothetical protein